MQEIVFYEMHATNLSARPVPEEVDGDIMKMLKDFLREANNANFSSTSCFNIGKISPKSRAFVLKLATKKSQSEINCVTDQIEKQLKFLVINRKTPRPYNLSALRAGNGYGNYVCYKPAQAGMVTIESNAKLNLQDGKLMKVLSNFAQQG
uniref:Uncharacterized protein n=1 Tax=Romanomermis culicivorax TaxID=13658 RepID=A0A915HJ89_ROMCU